MTTGSAIKRLVACFVAGILIFSAVPAWADWGEGVQGGPFVLHPGLSLSAGFDSNVYYSSARDNTAIHQSPEALIRPKLSVKTDNGGNWNLDADAAVGWRQYISDEERVRDQSGLSAELTGNARWNEEGPFSLHFSEEFVRTNEPPNSPSRRTINRIFNQAGIMAGLHPGGRILETFLSYDFGLYRHSDQVRGLDRHIHHFGWHGHWSFLPKTALTAEVDHRRIRYAHERRGGAVITPDGQLRNVDSNPVRIRGGIEGLITRRISVGARGGYSWSFYEEGPDFEGWIAGVEASYQFGNVDFDNRLRAGYKRDFSDSSLGNFYSSHRAVAGYEQGFVDNRLRLELEVDGEMRNYSDMEVSQVETEGAEIEFPDDISDLLVGVGASATYDIRKGWNVGLRYRLRSNFTDDTIDVERATVPADTVVRDYQRHHLLLSTELTY